MRQLTPSVEDYTIHREPFYRAVADEIDIFENAWKARLPVLLKGPTGCGKTRFVSHMAHRLGRPMVTVACHEDLSASDLLGRYLLTGDETVWVDGPLTTAVRHGAIVYLDEVVEARKDTLVVIHPLTDDRRILPIDRLATVLEAPAEFMMVVSYNPGYQSVLKELKPSTRQRFLSVDFRYPPPDIEREIVQRESCLDAERAGRLVKIGEKIRNLTDRGLEEGVSTRLLVYCGKLLAQGVEPRSACRAAFTRTLTDDRDLGRTIDEIVADYF
ncbi:MAG: CbbQ/NirQ/NorQ/GpvN family protein [Deltaproteobacteria bacterium]|nr:CbbQ/NirQ/NorQ/GpvN family protein [Deltaproteobacteria bacterium]